MSQLLADDPAPGRVVSPAPGHMVSADHPPIGFAPARPGPGRRGSEAIGGWQTAPLVVICAGVALVPMVIAHVIGAAAVHPLRDPISWYAFVPGGGELILLSAALLAVPGLLLIAAMYHRGLARGPMPAVMMLLFAASLVAVGVFPTDPPDALDASVSAVIHRFAAGTAFAVLPVLGLLLARALRRPRSSLPRKLRVSAWLLAVLVGLFLAIHLPLYCAGSGIASFGLLERIGFVIMIGYLLLIARIVDREGRPDGSAGSRAGRRSRIATVPTTGRRAA